MVVLSGRCDVVGKQYLLSIKEREQAEHCLATFPDSLQVLQDVFWALLNSNEFILAH